MSIQFGRWNFHGVPADEQFFGWALSLISRYGSDKTMTLFRGSFGTLFHAFDTTTDSRLGEQQQLSTPDGIVVTWDGRLDNRGALIDDLKLEPTGHVADLTIVKAAYERWGSGCFSRLVGDWALMVWDPTQSCLFLAKDFVGTRSLYYLLEPEQVTWCTVLDPLIFSAKDGLTFSEEYVAGYLSRYPAVHLTPYVEIRSVPACTFLRFKRGSAQNYEYRPFDPSKRIRYRSDPQYEEHFRSVFSRAVERRLRSSFPVLAELSGGMDSTSIVCVADSLIRQGKAETSRLDTISYYDDTEPNWNERPYFLLVEQRRGREGYHIDVSAIDGALRPAADAAFSPIPGQDELALNREKEFARCLDDSGCRMLLSGKGGDEFLGGVPAPTPELQDLFVGLHWLQMMRSITEWSLQRRKPWFHLAFRVFEGFLPEVIRRRYRRQPIAPWLRQDFVRRNEACFRGDIHRTSFFGAAPSFQANMSALDDMRCQLNTSHLKTTSSYRVSYPYLDRDFLAFLFAVPGDQLLRPRERRSLMRRALGGIVPPEVIARKRKAYIARHPLLLVNQAFPAARKMLESALVVEYGWADRGMLLKELEAAAMGQLRHLVPLLKVLRLELWLRVLAGGRIAHVVGTQSRSAGTRQLGKSLRDLQSERAEHSRERKSEGETHYVH